MVIYRRLQALIFPLWVGFGCQSVSAHRPSSQLFMRESGADKSQTLLLTADNQLRFSGIARIASDQSCTGAFITAGTSPESPAYLVTAGHCVLNFTDASSSSKVYRNARPKSDPNLVRFHFFAEQQKAWEGSLQTDPQQGRFRMGRVAYATMKGLDLAILEITLEDAIPGIYQLTDTADQEPEDAAIAFPKALTAQFLEKQGIHPLQLADGMPEFGARIRMISAPMPTPESGFDGYLREHSCRHEGQTSVVEYIWHWFDLTRNDCQDVLPGSSGAPILNAKNQVFAIVNTSTRDALSQDCYMGQPCEFTATGFQVAMDRNYGTDITWLRQCFDAHGFLEPEHADCKLDPGKSLLVKSQTRTPINPLKEDEKLRFWNVSLEEKNPPPQGVRYKMGPAPFNDCRSIEHYSPKIAWNAAKLQTLPLPLEPGLYSLCLVSEEDFSRQRMDHPTVVLADIDSTAPRLLPRLVSNPVTQEPLIAVRKSCKDLPNQANLDLRKKCAVAVVSFELRPPELVGFHYGWIGAKEVDCKHLKGEGEGLHAMIPVGSLPVRLCIWGVDGAGNRGERESVHVIRAATRREIMDATDTLVDWSGNSFVPPTRLN